MNAVEKSKEFFPYMKISDGISSLSFDFCGVTKIHESIHSVFFHHAILEHGMDVVIVNAYEREHVSEVESNIKESMRRFGI